VLRPRAVVIDVQIVKYVTLIAGLDKQTSNVDKTLHDLSTTYISDTTDESDTFTDRCFQVIKCAATKHQIEKKNVYMNTQKLTSTQKN